MAETGVFAERRLIEIEAATLCRWLDMGRALLVDVREEDEFAEDRISGALNMPLSSFDPARLPETGGRRLVLVCAVGRRSAQAAGILMASGHTEVTHLRGGMLSWDDAEYRTVSKEAVPAAQASPAALSPCT
jgi:rhodanese-related sulfurtransferase